ncbi:ScyD/ScyE family protein [Brachybacterium paraconglomeratum]|uniref:ScyD/ScyE family protein n=1 Tax=Brachybacterium paraconglomeratum TaxID=173362 RepID=UPI0037C7A5B4
MLGGATLPDCVAGASYTPEPVPTDVEVGKDGRLYVSTLQGALGESFPLSTVYKVSPRSGHTRTVADRGMQGATGLAVAPNGDILVAEMFGDAISTITPGRTKARTLVEVDAPADVEFERGTVYATHRRVRRGRRPRQRRRRLVPVPLRPLRPRGATSRRPPPRRTAGRGSRAAEALSAQMS